VEPAHDVELGDRVAPLRRRVAYTSSWLISQACSSPLSAAKLQNLQL
jgi:hypothetical protein